MFQHLPLLDMHFKKGFRRYRISDRPHVLRLQAAFLQHRIQCFSLRVLQPLEVSLGKPAQHGAAAQSRGPEPAGFFTHKQHDFQ